MHLSHQTNYLYYVLLTIAVAVNISALDITILAPDGALYATISRTMAQQNNYVELFVEGRDWLDKPHFPFWMTAFSFELFGFTSFAYKLPAILFLLMGAFYTYRLAYVLYDQKVARWSTIIMLTAQHIMISNNDVRAEPYLTGLIIASVYHLYKTSQKLHMKHLMLGALFAACAVMTKGIFALVPIGFAIAGELMIKKRWTDLVHWKWLIVAVLILLFITPELYALYVQFDQHPEKIVFGRQNVSGIRFFFWDSQFGRFMNTGPIKGKGDPTFFLHTTLWAFLPWSIMLYAAIIVFIRRNWKYVQEVEWLTLCGSLSTFLLFSLSKFQLPHYINIIFPFFSILTASYILKLHTEKGVRFFIVTQWILAGIYVAGMFTLIVLFRPSNTIMAILLVGILICLLLFVPRRIAYGKKEKAFAASVIAAAILNLFINRVMYPEMMKYQSGSEAAFYINKNIPNVPVVQLRKYISYPLEFYLDEPIIYIDSVQQFGMMSRRPLLLFIPENEDSILHKDPVKEFPHFPISRLTGKFINYSTRSEAVEQYRLYSFP